jgi:hypothetical protein
MAALIGTGVTAVSAQKVDKTYEEFRGEACQKFLERSKKVNEELKLASWPRWDYEQETGELVFSEKGVPKVIAKVQAAGSWSKFKIPGCGLGTAVAGHLLNAKTAYRAPDENGDLYLLVFDIRWADKN